MNRTNQGLCQSRKTAENGFIAAGMANFPNQELAWIPT
jgi:hypothetical protein